MSYQRDEYEGYEEDGGFIDDDMIDAEMMAQMQRGGGGAGGQMSLQATAELYQKKLLHKDFFNDFTDDCDDDDLE